MVEKPNNGDADIAQCKKDVFAARLDLSRAPALDESYKDNPEQSIPHQTPIQSLDNNSQQTDIPKFDLAEEIMAAQRKITAARRKAPGKKPVSGKVPRIESPLLTLDEHQAPTNEERTLPTGNIASQPIPACPTYGWSSSPGQSQIIAEIVARDIEKLCQKKNHKS